MVEFRVSCPNVGDPSVGVDGIPPGLSGVEIPSLGVVLDWISS